MTVIKISLFKAPLFNLASPSPWPLNIAAGSFSARLTFQCFFVLVYILIIATISFILSMYVYMTYRCNLTESHLWYNRFK